MRVLPVLIALLCVFMTAAIAALIGYLALQSSKQEIADFELRRISATTAKQLDALCIEGYYQIPGEKRCSRAPKCGTTPYDSYEWVRDNVPMPDLAECTDEDKGPLIGNPPGLNAFAGYVPLCCYEMARTHDPYRCVTDWERQWCHPEQCAQINNDSGCGDESCQCGEGIRQACDKTGCDLRSPVPLNVRLSIPGTEEPMQESMTEVTVTARPQGEDQMMRETPAQTEQIVQEPTPTPASEIATGDVPPTPPTDPAVTNTPPPDPTRPTPTVGESTPAPTLGNARATPTSTAPPARDTVAPTKADPTTGPRCDASCGVCGWRDAKGQCQSDQPKANATQLCCYHICRDHSCVAVHGYGANACSSDAQCVSQTAYSQTATNTPVPATYNESAPPPPQVTPPVSGSSNWLIYAAIPAVIILLAVVF